jgi:hypothetical protein
VIHDSTLSSFYVVFLRPSTTCRFESVRFSQFPRLPSADAAHSTSIRNQRNKKTLSRPLDPLNIQNKSLLSEIEQKSGQEQDSVSSGGEQSGQEQGSLSGSLSSGGEHSGQKHGSGGGQSNQISSYKRRQMKVSDRNLARTCNVARVHQVIVWLLSQSFSALNVSCLARMMSV